MSNKEFKESILSRGEPSHCMGSRCWSCFKFNSNATPEKVDPLNIGALGKDSDGYVGLDNIQRKIEIETILGFVMGKSINLNDGVKYDLTLCYVCKNIVQILARHICNMANNILNIRHYMHELNKQINDEKLDHPLDEFQLGLRKGLADKIKLYQPFSDTTATHSIQDIGIPSQQPSSSKELLSGGGIRSKNRLTKTYGSAKIVGGDLVTKRKAYKPGTCRYCSAKFTANSNMLRHVRKIHNIEPLTGDALTYP